MGIVERAVQEAQQKATGEGHPTPEPGTDFRHPASGGGGAAAVERDGTMSVEHTVAVGKVDAPCPDASLTSRDLKTIVHVDFDRLREQGRVPSEAMATQTEEEMRRIKWPLLKAVSGAGVARSARNNVILVTSALPGEGKTFTALNLALNIVRDPEVRVVLVDGDVARPGLTPSLGLEDRAGLVEALEDVNLDVSSVTYQTDIDGLFFVPAGKWHPHSPELMAGTRMPEVIDALSRRVGQGVIIVDSPPLLATNEAQVVTRLAGQVLLVVRADDTPKKAVLDAIELVDDGTSISCVLNRVEPSALSRYYGRYHYGHRYGDRYGYPRRGESGDGRGNVDS